MTYNVTATFSIEEAKLSGSYPLDMYVINASLSGVDYDYYVNLNQDVYGFQLNASGDVTSNEQLYKKAFVKREDLTSNTQGEIGNISISIPNVDRSLESIIQSRDFLRGCEVYVLTTFAPLLPSGSTAEHIGVDPDYRSVLKEKYYIDSTNSDENFVTFNCKSKFDIRGIIVPGRCHSRECQWEFRSTECDPDGNIAASWNDCDYTLESCRKRKNDSRFGGFVSIPQKAIIII